jgi:hypothetical protein
MRLLEKISTLVPAPLERADRGRSSVVISGARDLKQLTSEAL